MKVILQKDVPNLGTIGDLVKVKDGYGRNFLLPRGLAVLANESNTRQLNHQKRLAQTLAAKQKAAAEAAAKHNCIYSCRIPNWKQVKMTNFSAQ